MTVDKQIAFTMIVCTPVQFYDNLKPVDDEEEEAGAVGLSGGLDTEAATATGFSSVLYEEDEQNVVADNELLRCVTVYCLC